MARVIAAMRNPIIVAGQVRAEAGPEKIAEQRVQRLGRQDQDHDDAKGRPQGGTREPVHAHADGIGHIHLHDEDRGDDRPITIGETPQDPTGHRPWTLARPTLMPCRKCSRVMPFR